MWNYRIIKKSEDNYGLYEVFYNDDKEIFGHSENPEVWAESPNELIEQLSMMLSDAIKCKGDELELDKIEFADAYDDKDLSEAITFEEFEKLIKEMD